MTAWHNSAACIGVPADMFFPSPGTHSETTRKVLAICASCPVRDECLQDAFNEERHRHDRYGIRGGLTAIERTHAAGDPTRTVLDDPEHLHGTRALYRQGCRCAACTDAQRAYHLDWRQRRLAKAGGR